MDADDATLVGLARTGDKAALAELLRRHAPLLAGLCRRALADATLAEDAVQEACLAAMLNLDRLRRPDRFGPWLAGIGLNVCRRWRRQRAREAWSSEAMPGGRRIAVDPLGDEAADPAALVEEAEARERVRRAVAALPAGQRAAVALVYLAGLTQREAAVELGIGDGAVKGRLFKARAALRRRLGDDTGEEAVMGERQEGERLVAVRVYDVRRSAAGDGENAPCRHVVVLQEAAGDRLLPIWLGQFEATAIALHLVGAEHPRPLTYAFAAGLLAAGGVHLREVRIHRLVEDTYYAEAAVDGPGGTATVDARPSDAINLALVMDAPIRLAAGILDANALAPDETAAVGANPMAATIAAEALAGRAGVGPRAL